MDPQEENSPSPHGVTTARDQAPSTLPGETSPFGSVFHPLILSQEKRELTELGTGESEMHAVFASFLNEPISKNRFSLSVPPLFHLSLHLP